MVDMTDHDALIALAKSQITYYGKNSTAGKIWQTFLTGLQPPPPTTPALFATATWLNQKVPSSTRVDPNSAAIVSALNGPGNRVLIAGAYALPIYRMTTGYCSIIVDTEGSWGWYNLSTTTVPLSANVVPNPGSDGKVVIDDGNWIYDLAHFAWVDSAPHCAYGGVYPRSGDARGVPANYWPTIRDATDTLQTHTPPVQWNSSTKINRGTGSGICSLAGCITLAEAKAGLIPHALTAATSLVIGNPDVPNSQDYRYPASATDHGGGIVKEGMRVHLPISTTELAAITNPAQRMVAVALRDYGLYFTDGGGALIAINRELPKPGDADPWPALGADMGYFGLDQIPWNRLRVLARWDGK